MFPGNAKGLAVGDIHLLARDKILVAAKHSLLIPPLCRRIVKCHGGYGSLCLQLVQSNVVGAR